MRQNAIHLNQTPLEPPPKRTKAEQHLYQDVTIEEDSVQPTAREETYLQLICVYAANTSTNAIEAIGAGKLSGNEWTWSLDADHATTHPPQQSLGTIVVPDIESTSHGNMLSERKYLHMYHLPLTLSDGQMSCWFCDCPDGREALKVFQGDITTTTTQMAELNLEQYGDCVHKRSHQAYKAHQAHQAH
jgi:hypothetical protein